MSSLLHRIGLWCASHAARIFTAWLLLIAALGGLIAATGMNLSSSFTISGSESIDGLTILTERLPQAAGTSEQILITATDGDITAHSQQIERFVGDLAGLDNVAMVPDPFSPTTYTVSDDGAHVLIQVQADTAVGSIAQSSGSAGPNLAKRIATTAEQLTATDPALTVDIAGKIGQTVDIGLSATELLGVLVAALVLLITFGSVLAAGAPIVGAFIGVASGMLGILALANVTEINSVTPVLAVMIGLAVGIDYALFIISRAREYLAKGVEPREAAARADATAGSAVVFAGVTVMIALCGLAVAGIPFLTTMGVSSALMVGMAVAVALTVTPALLGLMGSRIAPKPSKREKRDGFRQKWIHGIMRAPKTVALATVGLLLVLAIPVSGVKLALTDNGSEPVGTQLRDTYDKVAAAYGEGYNSPIIVIADIVQTTDPLTVVAELADDLSQREGVERVALATPNQDASIALVQIIPTGSQSSDEATALVKEIRAAAPSIEEEFGIRNIMVTGQTAVAIDISNQLNAALLPFGIVVVGLSLILLMIVFRSIAVPITATLGYVLSLGAGMGAVGAIWGWEWLAGALNVAKTGPVIAFLPVIVMGVLFGLAMDYEVFLVSRMREEWMRSGNARHAIRAGFTGSSQVVTAAAIIMTAVFAAFIPMDNIYIKPIAVALTVGIFADAFLVRMTLIPALMTVLGDKAWWLPRWLDRLLPVVDIEGEGLQRTLEHAAWVEHNGASAVRAECLRIADGADVLIDSLSFAVRPGELAVVLGDDPAARRALSAAISGRLRISDGILVVGDHALPDGTPSVQGMTRELTTWDDAVSARARVIVCDDPGKRRWSRVVQLLASGRTVVVTGPSGLGIPDDVVPAVRATLGAPVVAK